MKYIFGVLLVLLFSNSLYRDREKKKNERMNERAKMKEREREKKKFTKIILRIYCFFSIHICIYTYAYVNDE